MTVDKAHQLISRREFVAMLGLKDINWVYKHANDPGFPQIVKVGRSTKFALEECEAYVERLKKAREPLVPEPVKRKRGRPRKNPAPVTPPSA